MDIQLNLSNSTRSIEPPHKSKNSLNRSERLNKKRLERREVNKQIDNLLKQKGLGPKDIGSTATLKPTKQIGTNKKNTETLSHAAGQKKYSSLFRSNPVIPQVDKVNVQQVSEAVFADRNFADLDLHDHIVSTLKQRFGFEQTTTVQKKVIPHVLAGSDVLVKSQTGSGKTLAYAIPLVEELQKKTLKIDRQDGPYALSIVPTRELALQSYETFQKLLQPFQWIVPGCVMGGEKKKSEKARLRKGVNILIATPGRLLDHLENTKTLVMDNLRWLVIDEADRLLDMGFEKEVSKIVTYLKQRSRGQLQSILLSATLSSGIERLAGMSLHEPVTIDITDAPQEKLSLVNPKENEDKFAMPSNLEHHFVIVPNKLRLTTLTAFILWKCKLSQKKSKMIVFLSTQDSVDFHEQMLSQTLNNATLGEEEGENTTTVDFYKLHGNMQQVNRTRIFQEFTNATSGVLLCTDVAARGLDLPQVRWIVQYNTPSTAADYIHRVGRTARAGAHGRALLFLTPSEVEYLKVLNKSMISFKEMKMDDILQTLLVEAQTGSWLRMSKGGMPHTAQESATCLQMKFEDLLQSDKVLRTSARKAYQSFIRAYSTYPAHLKHIFHIKTLHLGHVAKSFGLQDAPTQIGTMVGKYSKMDNKSKGKKRKRDQSSDGPKRKLSKLETTEFASGLSGARKMTRKKVGRTGVKKKTFKKR